MTGPSKKIGYQYTGQVDAVHAFRSYLVGMAEVPKLPNSEETHLVKITIAEVSRTSSKIFINSRTHAKRLAMGWNFGPEMLEALRELCEDAAESRKISGPRLREIQELIFKARLSWP